MGRKETTTSKRNAAAPGAPQKILSIRLSPGGLSFWTSLASSGNTGAKPDRSRMERFEGDSPETSCVFDPRLSVEKNIARCVERMKPYPESAPAVVFVDSPKSVSIPASLFDKDAVGELLEIHNFEVGNGEGIYISPVIADTVSIVIADAALIEALEDGIGVFQIASLLQYNILRSIPDGKKKTSGRIMVYLCPERAYVSVLQGGESGERLLFAESLPYRSEADLIYYIDWLGKQLGTSDSPIFIKGVDADKILKAVSRYFKNCRCG